MPTDDVEIKFELDLGEAPRQLLKWAQDNIREDPDKTCQMLDDFRDMIYSRGECTPHRTDDAFLLRYLRSRKFALEAAYRLFVNHWDFKEENPSFYKGVGLDTLDRAGECDVMNVPPYRDQHGRRILLYKLGNWMPEVFSTDDLFGASLLILELAILEPKCQISGGICIVDCANMTMQHVLWMTPSVARKVIQMAVTANPMRLGALHIVNQSWAVDVVFNIFKPFLHEKMREKIYFHGNDMESLHKHVDPKCLPDIYGGLQPDYAYKPWIDGFRKNEAILKELRADGYEV